ncbi:FabD/lysophospholipase-like protein [Ramaria rubella]|nr:FabD/lysophospholipase-like protein [Ramaria rubella]
MSEDHALEGLRLLSLDGGGIRGLSELLILQEIMHRIKEKEQLTESPLPCRYFDLIGGTSTGGIIALMLGRLGMSVAEAIECYGTLAQRVFSDVKPFGKDGKFKASKLEEIVKEIVKRKTQNAEERLLSGPRNQGCKTFVCTRTALSMRGPPRLFRTYETPKYPTFNCTIWEAARATSAAPTFFKQIMIGQPGSQEYYIDGGIGCNNPIKQILEEAQVIFPGRTVACVISIGTGQSQTIGIPTPNLFQRVLPLDVIQVLRSISTDCEQSAQEIAQRFQSLPNVYIRFNVEQGLQGVGLSQWERLHEVTTHTGQYIRNVEVNQKLDIAVAVISGKRGVVATSHIGGAVESVTCKKPHIKACPPPVNIFTGRQDILNQMHGYFSNDIGKRHTFVLYGLGGAGKSQIAYKFVEISQSQCQREPSRFSDVFFIDASNTETINTDFKNIAYAKGVGESLEDTLQWLASQYNEWLLLFNNADDAALNMASAHIHLAHRLTVQFLI